MPIGSLWLAVILSAVAVFVVSSVIHMVLKYHKADMRKLPDEEGIRDAVRKAGPAPGLYFSPYCPDHSQMNDPATRERFTKGPVMLVTVLPNGLPAMPKYLGQWFVYCLVVSFVTAYVARHTLAPGADGMLVMRIAGTVAFTAYGLAHVSDSIWKGQPWGNTCRDLLDALAYGLTTGAVFMGLWPAA